MDNKKLYVIFGFALLIIGVTAFVAGECSTEKSEMSGLADRMRTSLHLAERHHARSRTSEYKAGRYWNIYRTER
jgi:hypothetical protein